ncbi:unnamed protein product [Dicrocoelium dendriticum]|nr:unnamed protein product [Dicrocoelium dendriticum]
MNQIVQCKWNEASHLFCELVDRIISEFVPRLNRIRLALIQQGRPPFEGHATPVKDQQEATEEAGVTTPFPDPIQAPVAIHPYETRAELEKRFTFFTLNDKPESSSHLHDVGKSRVAVVVHALYNYVLASFRAVKESGLPFLGATFHRVLRQYPRQQLSQALSLLLANQMVNRVKFSMPEEEYRIFNAKKLKLSSR